MTNPFPNVFEEPLNDLQTQVIIIGEGGNEQALDVLVRRTRVFHYDALPQLLWGIVHHILAQISCRATLSLRADTLGFFAPQWVAGGSFSERQSVFERSGYRFA